MKKLMIAATAAMAGATTFGGLCDPDAAGTDSCTVYNIKFTFKTLAAKTACAQGAKWLVTDSVPGAPNAVWYRNSNADNLARADNTTLVPAGTAAGTVDRSDYLAIGAAGTLACPTAGAIANADHRLVFWMDNATRKFEGVAWQCKYACFEGLFSDCDLTNNGRLNYVLWEKRNRLAISFPVFQAKIGESDGGTPPGFKNNTYETLYFSRDAQREMFIGRYGKKAQKVAAYWGLYRLLHAQTIDAAGFGTYDVKNLRTKSVSGNAVGMIMPIQDGATDECGNKDRIFCALGFMCVEWMDWCCDGCYAGVELVPASGTWSLKYNASATKKANKDKAKLTDFVPDYMFYRHSAWNDAKALDPWLHADNYYWVDTSATPWALFYKDGSAAAEVTQDAFLDYIAEGACKVIDVAFDGVIDADGTKYYILERDAKGSPKKDDDGNYVKKEYELEGDEGKQKTLKADDLFGEFKSEDSSTSGS
jgi:hypothetical protein